jgi:PAS domain S-box-containing protein
MTSEPIAKARLAGKKSLRLLFILFAVTLCVAFFGELAVMFALPYLLPANAGKWTEALFDAGLLSTVLTGFILPLMLHYRARNLRVERRALRLQYTLDQHAIVSITDAAGRITFANERFCKISGYTRQELIGQDHRLLKSGQHLPEVYIDMWHTISHGRTWHGEVCNRRKNGSLYWVHATITPFMNEVGAPEEYIAIRTEITAQKQLEEASRQQEAWLRIILDNLGEGVYTLDSHGRLDYMNAEAERLIGWRLEELAGKVLHDIIHHHRPDGQPLPAAECPIHLAMLDRCVYRSSDEVFFHKDGTRLPVTITGAPLALEGEWKGSVAVFSDMREEQLLRQHLLDAKEAAEEATRLKADFLSTMSHEIRTPLNGVIGMTDLLLDTPLDNEQTEFARIIKISADALLAIINDILDFSKIEAGRLVLEHADFSLRQIIEGNLDVLAGKAHEKELTLASFIAPGLPDHLIGDPTRIRQILLNFLSNAIKFTEHGEVVVSAQDESGTENEADKTATTGATDIRRRVLVKLAVRDSGIGLSETARAILFQPFSQADSSTTRKYGGTGLGLSICKRLVEAMGGEIGVDSAPGEGATFWVRIPLDVADDKRAHVPPAADLRGKRVLIAGGSEGSRAVWCAYFEAWQVHCGIAPSFAELRRRLAELEDKGLAPDALLLAQPLSDVTLIEAVASLLAEGKCLPLVCCLARPDREMKSILTAQGIIVVEQPLKQSLLFNALMTTPAAMQAASARRMFDAADHTKTVAVSDGQHRLLLAEDNPVNQRVAVHLLSKLGYAVDVVDNGALAVAAAATGNYDLLLMDCQMPEMDGFEAAAAIRRAEINSTRHLPIVAMTANALQGDREQCLASGMDDYIAKPIGVARLSEVLVAWLPEEATVSGAAPRAVSSAPTSDLASAPIDMKRLTDLFGDDDTGINELLMVFEQSLPPLRERLKREVSGHGDGLRSLAHELRGTAANIGALPLAELAGRMEKLAANGNWEEIETLATRIADEFIRTSSFVIERTKHLNA